MQDLEAFDIQGMLRDASKHLRDDRAILGKLFQELESPDRSQWDLVTIARLLAKGGKLSEAETVANLIEINWQRAKAYMQMGQELVALGDPPQGLPMLSAAILFAQGTDTKCGDKVETDKVLAQVAEAFAGYDRPKDALQAAEAITDSKLKEKTLANLKSASPATQAK